jgi:hypothetical protein
MKTRFALSAAVSLATLAVCAQAQTTPQSAFLERSQVLASDKQIRVYRLPTTNANNKVSYWDATVELTIGSDGKPVSSELVRVVKSPKFVGSDFVAGTYLDSFGNSCTVTTGSLDGGRQEGTYSCPLPNGQSGFWASGPLVGHPIELDLRAAGFDEVNGFENYAWGKVGAIAFNRTEWSCFNVNEIISARQVGNQIVITNYGSDNLTDCGMTLTRQEP